MNFNYQSTPSDYIELRIEKGWKKPVQVYSYFTNKYGKIFKRHWFSEYYSFEEAILFLSKNHKYEIRIIAQTAINFAFYPKSYKNCDPSLY